MLVKMIKYDLKYAARSLLTLFTIFGGLAFLLISFSSSETFFNLRIILAILMVPLSIVMAVMYIVTTVQLYYKSLFSNEGYLTHTLPISSQQLLISKIITGLIWGVACLVIYLIYGLAALIANDGLSQAIEVFREAAKFLTVTNVALFLFVMLAASIEALSSILFCCCVSAIPAFKNRNFGVPAGIIAYFLISYISGRIQLFVGTNFTFRNLISMSGSEDWISTMSSIQPPIFIVGLISLGITAALFFGANYLMQKHKTL